MRNFRFNQILFFIALIILVLDYLNRLSFIKVPLEAFVNPLKKSVFDVSNELKLYGKLAINLPSTARVKDEYLRIKRENENLVFENRMLIKENSELREQLGSDNPSGYRFIPARVLSLTRFMGLDAGTKQGVKKDMPVVSGQVLVGKIYSVTENSSSVMLLSDAEIKVAAKTARGSRGEVTGQFGENIILDQVLQKDAIFIDDEVLSAGGDIYPPNLLIGRINYIKSDDVSVYKQGKISYPLDVGGLDMVYIALPK